MILENPKVRVIIKYIVVLLLSNNCEIEALVIFYNKIPMPLTYLHFLLKKKTTNYRNIRKIPLIEYMQKGIPIAFFRHPVTKSHSSSVQVHLIWHPLP